MFETEELISQGFIYQSNKGITEHGFREEQHIIKFVSLNKGLTWLMKALNGN